VINFGDHRERAAEWTLVFVELPGRRAEASGVLLLDSESSELHLKLRRDWDENSQNNGYLLNQIVRKYEDGNPDGVGSVFSVPDQINALTGTAVQQAAQNYLSMDNYVRVTLMPETK